jgi:hypothetical protein
VDLCIHTRKYFNKSVFSEDEPGRFPGDRYSLGVLRWVDKRITLNEEGSVIFVDRCM